MAPIRVGIVGLSPEPAGAGQGKWGVSAHLASLRPSPHYEIVAICNSSVESARRSIEYHKLPSSVKAYGSVEDLANDPDVDLIDVSIVVSRHLLAAKPALLAKKEVFVEWPLGASTAQAEEMLQLAIESNLRTIVGTQFCADPWLAKAKELIESGAIGRVTSSDVQISPPTGPIHTWTAEAEFYLDFESGGDEYHITFAHFLSGFVHVLGDFASVKSTFAVQQPIVKLISSKTGEVVNPERKRTSPDHIFIQGMLESGAVVSISTRTPPRPIDGQGFRWLISGAEGEIELATKGRGYQTGSNVRTLRLVTKDGEVKTIDWEQDEPSHIKNVPPPGANTARLFEAYALKKDCYSDFEKAVKLHKLLDRIAKDAGYM
ncbi:oxidoreductase family, NAD-binding rossmann fold domain-containing protein [Trichoderma breve]|uniref:Oxidoreductase family, NAD-binding rossmann fold domain-containing protein n=1 Tax=Trichoderma breve TaxID=2034170 RepID=A0A9W9B8B8_9HYPO|nr:oxidoreductase family, NAD-binding rossmann fold domain-containing protein [Trichoderma breve]KAJ4854861.1 oxidoreductase family, NAD-binding rossmann fold domain-containing protein [Trichoderma breve]